ncbi:MAG: hypothetical protein K6E36_02780 [Oscillospiraceae bacterium]|nr:hypothetical protein [Oscillospiraceae bacterium]
MSKLKTCEICGCPLYLGSDTRCQRCLDAPKVKVPGSFPERSPIMAKPDPRYSLRNERQVYDGIPDPELPVYYGHPDYYRHPDAGGFERVGTAARYNPSDAAYKVWLRFAYIWAGVTFVLTMLLAWRHHLLIAAVWTAVTALILGFCTPSRYMQEEFVPEQFLTHRLARAVLLLLIGGVPAFFTGWLFGFLLGKIV